MGTSICVGCGLCCDGSIFGFVPLRPGDDEAVLIERGLTIEDREGERTFALGCDAVCDGVCTIYEDRPTVCRSYRCQLLRAHDAGTVATDDALRRIEATKALRDEVREGVDHLVPDEVAGNLYERCNSLVGRLARQQGAEPDAEGARASDSAAAAEVLLNLAALRVQLSTHFEQAATSGPAQPDVPVMMSEKPQVDTGRRG